MFWCRLKASIKSKTIFFGCLKMILSSTLHREMQNNVTDRKGSKANRNLDWWISERGTGSSRAAGVRFLSLPAMKNKVPTKMLEIKFYGKTNKKQQQLCGNFFFFFKETWQFYLIQFLPFMPLRLTTTHVKQLIKPEGNTWNGFSLSEENDDWLWDVVNMVIGRSVCLCVAITDRERVRQIGTPFLLICCSTSSTHNSSKGGE